jgi:excinuclease ABC subunit B
VITPRTVQKRISSLRESIWEADYVTVPTVRERAEAGIPPHELPELIAGLRREMQAAAKALDFERAAELRDRLRELEEEHLRVG